MSHIPTVAAFARKDHPAKTSGYNFVFKGLIGPLRNAFLMPSALCNDVKHLIAAGVVSTDTHLYVVERDPETHAIMLAELKKLGFSEIAGNLTDYLCNLYEVPELPTLDLIFLDLFGSIVLPDADWMANVMSKSICSTTRFVFTAQVLARNNAYVKEMWRIVQQHIPSDVKDFCDQLGLDDDKIVRPIFWLNLIFDKFDFRRSQVYKYSDTDGSTPSFMFTLYLSGFQERVGAVSISHADIVAEIDPAKIAAFYRHDREGIENEAKKRDQRRILAKNAALAYAADHGKRVVVDGDEIIYRETSKQGSYISYKTYFELCYDQDIEIGAE